MLDRLLDIVSDRTGYPKEALSIDLDLEADLGIDSIKRIEILSTMAETLEHHGMTGSTGANLEMEKLTVIKTLRGIVDYIEQATAQDQSAQPAAEPTPAAAAKPAEPDAPGSGHAPPLAPPTCSGWWCRWSNISHPPLVRR
jgi:acyl carrier protein